MKLTKSELKQIIKEELEYVGSEIENISDEDELYTAEPSRTEEVAEKLGVEDPEVIRIIDRVMRMKQERDSLKQQVKDYLEGRSDVYPYPD